MQRVHAPLVDGAAGRDQRLGRDLPAEHALAILVGAQPPKQVHLELLELQQVDQVVERHTHRAQVIHR